MLELFLETLYLQLRTRTHTHERARTRTTVRNWRKFAVLLRFKARVCLLFLSEVAPASSVIGGTTSSCSVSGERLPYLNFMCAHCVVINGLTAD